ncbi:MAG: single-stranded DNA-binding protein [Bacilli bacterium]|nr:single-stranded DNA-binding protein [Bacilli bacterium]
MLNNLVLVGRVSSEPRIKIFDDGSKVCNFDLAVDRPFKSQEGTRETDFFPVTIWQGYADAVYTYCGPGSVIGVKGRLVTHYQEVGGVRVKSIDIIGERVAFINAIPQKEKDIKNIQVDDDECRDINEAIEKEVKKAKKKEVKEEE